MVNPTSLNQAGFHYCCITVALRNWFGHPPKLLGVPLGFMYSHPKKGPFLPGSRISMRVSRCEDGDSDCSAPGSPPSICGRELACLVRRSFWPFGGWGACFSIEFCVFAGLVGFALLGGLLFQQTWCVFCCFRMCVTFCLCVACFGFVWRGDHLLYAL